MFFSRYLIVFLPLVLSCISFVFLQAKISLLTYLYGATDTKLLNTLIPIQIKDIYKFLPRSLSPSQTFTILETPFSKPFIYFLQRCIKKIWTYFGSTNSLWKDRDKFPKVIHDVRHFALADNCAMIRFLLIFSTILQQLQCSLILHRNKAKVWIQKSNTSRAGSAQFFFVVSTKFRKDFVYIPWANRAIFIIFYNCGMKSFFTPDISAWIFQRWTA